MAASTQNCIIHMKSGKSFHVNKTYEEMVDKFEGHLDNPSGNSSRLLEVSEAKGAEPLKTTLDMREIEAVGQIQ